MGKMITIHSYKGGTGKSQISVNLATLYALNNKKVALLDLDFRAPTLHEVFRPEKIKCFINAVLDGKANIEDCLIDCSKKINKENVLYVGFADFSTEAIKEMVSRGRKWEIEAFKKLLNIRRKLLSEMGFDYIIIDTSPGVMYLSINAAIAADLVILITTLDESDINGTKKMIEELYEIFETKTFIVINKAIGDNKKELLNKLKEEFKEKLIEVIPCSCEIGSISRSSIFVLEKPNHPITEIIKEIANKLA
ncbi:MAG: MinD/ParA family protein [Candidatus Methanomethylicaceae archaeon]|nr:MinD/ParA family protein [Candidatus Verstraetearchaeota archaeon]